MATTDQLYFTAYIRPETSTTIWFHDVLHKFWQYGLSYRRQAPMDKTLRWEEELEQLLEFAVIGSVPQNQTQTLAQWMEQATMAGSGSLYAYDKDLEIIITLQPDKLSNKTEIDKPESILGKITFRYERSFLNKNHGSIRDPLPLYLQTWQAHVHWAEVCCTLLSPIYGFSYQEGWKLREHSSFRRCEHIDIEQRLLARELPVLSALVSQSGLQYFGRQILNDQRERELTHHAYHLTTFLPTGGLLFISPTEPFHYGYGLGYNFTNRATQAYEDEEQNEEIGDRFAERGTALIDRYRQFLA